MGQPESETLVIQHWIAATPEQVWHAWTTPELFHQFFSPDGLHIPLESVVIELWVGGRFECTMIFDESGEANENKGVLTEVAEPHRLVGEEPSIGFRSVQTFTADGDGTLIRVEQSGLPAELIGNAEVHAAFRSSYRKLGRLLGADTEERDCC
jgi:uncharacterized protein YndB with AHSA1/START domain